MFRFPSTTLDALREPTAIQWDQQTATHLLATYPRHFEALGATAADLSALCCSVRERAAGFGMTTRRDVRKIAIAAVSLGVGFFDDPRFDSEIGRALADDALAPDEKTARIEEATLEWVAYAWNGSTLADLGERIEAALSRPEDVYSDRESLLEILKAVLPGQGRLLNEDANIRFYADCFAAAEAHGLTDPVTRTAYTACALAHGLHWFDDPQYRTLRAVFEKADGQTALRRALGNFYAEFA